MSPTFQTLLGATALWFPRAVTGPGASPKVATIIAINDAGCADLQVIEPFGEPVVTRGVHAAGSIHLYEVGTTKFNNGALRSGCWELSPFAQAVLAVNQQEIVDAISSGSTSLKSRRGSGQTADLESDDRKNRGRPRKADAELSSVAE